MFRYASMKCTRPSTVKPYGFVGTGASPRWSGLDVHATKSAMANAKATAQRPLGLVGGNTG